MRISSIGDAVKTHHRHNSLETKHYIAGLLLALTPLLATAAPAVKDEDVVELEEVTVIGDVVPEASEELNAQTLDNAKLATDKTSASDTASLFKDIPGVTMNTGGGVSSLPSIHGMADDRVKISVNGMSITSACSNHMNPALSYMAPNSVGQAVLMAGITPVSMGGDSIGGTIAVDALAPKFASVDQKTLFSGQTGGFFRSANDNFGVNSNAQYATRDLSFDYNFSGSKAGNYQRGDDGPAVIPTSFFTTNLGLRAAKALDKGFISADVNLQHIPIQGFPNQRMDVVENNAVLGGISFENYYDWGKLDARLYHHQTWHTMDTLDERHTAPMLMRADGSDYGYRVRGHLYWSDVHTFRIGSEFARQTLQDWWPKSNGQPNDFLSINNGERNRLGTFLEWQADWDAKWTTQVGLRNDMVWMNTGQVHGYYPTQTDLEAVVWEPKFNAADRARVDTNFDATAQTRYTHDASSQYELGFARKTRSPNLYERYAWYGHNSMVTWFGDGNSYMGNIGLKPEVAYNFSLSGTWNDPDKKIWSAKLSPYYTHITDYIWGQAEAGAPGGFRGLQFVNLPYADLYGVDASGRYAFLPESQTGSWAVRSKLAYVRGIGENDLSGRPCPYAAIGLAGVCNAKGWPVGGLQAPEKVNLYHMMPLYGSINLENSIQGDWGSLGSEIGIDLVKNKATIAESYSEPKTPGYVLLNVRSSYQYQKLKLDFGVDNILDKLYYHPMGGVDIVGTYAQGFPIPRLLPVAAMGRSVFVSVNVAY